MSDHCGKRSFFLYYCKMFREAVAKLWTLWGVFILHHWHAEILSFPTRSTQRIKRRKVWNDNLAVECFSPWSGSWKCVKARHASEFAQLFLLPLHAHGAEQCWNKSRCVSVIWVVSMARGTCFQEGNVGFEILPGLITEELVKCSNQWERYIQEASNISLLIYF